MRLCAYDAPRVAAKRACLRPRAYRRHLWCLFCVPSVAFFATAGLRLLAPFRRLSAPALFDSSFGLCASLTLTNTCPEHH